MKAFLGITLLLALTIASSSTSDKLRFDNFTVYRVTPKDDSAVVYLRELEHEYPTPYRFWSEVRGVGIPVDIMVSPDHKNDLKSIANKIHIDTDIMIENVQERIDKEGLRPESRAGRFGWTDYYTLDEINAWLQSLVQQYSGIVSLLNVGNTYQGRTIYGIKISYNPSNKNNSVFVESNIHAREWISSAVSTYIINQLLTSLDPIVRQVAETHDWYFVPVANPDGFVHTHTSDRMWRKTRVPYNVLCYGADPNRNWGYNWNQGGSSSQPCSDTYHGPSAFSEPSTRTLSSYITTIANDLVAFISFHSYSQMFLLPYGHTTAHLDNYDEMYYVGTFAQKAIAERYGTQYVLGNVAETIYVASGASMDWVKGVYRVPIAFTYELRDKGTHGFILPANQIIPTGEETLDSVITILDVGKQFIPPRN